jgi:hypothetical protein
VIRIPALIPGLSWHPWQPIVGMETNFFPIEGICGGESHLRNFGGTRGLSLRRELPDKRAGLENEKPLDTASQRVLSPMKRRAHVLSGFDVIKLDTFRFAGSRDLGRDMRSIRAAPRVKFRGLLRRSRISVKGERHKEKSPPRRSVG